MNVNVIGLGYIGLPTALALAANGVEVVGTDVNSTLIEKLNRRELTFEEQGLSALFERALSNHISFQTHCDAAALYIIAVPTPYEKEGKKLDPQYVVKAAKAVLEICPDQAVLVIESTIAPGTIDQYIRPLLQGRAVHLAHAPERIIPGNMVYELTNNARTIGADCPEVAQQVRQVYENFCRGEIILTNIRTAEMTKVVENTYRDINIAFANELVKICRSDSLDVYEIIRIANCHPRVNILTPGPGVGGHCISVDPWFLVGSYPGLANIILAARKINDSMPEFVLERIHEIMKEHHLTDVSRVGFYGLTYKEDVDDTRESPTLQIIKCMEKHLASGIKIYDPFVKKDIVENQMHNFDKFILAVDLIVILVAHNEIKQQIQKIKGKIVLDTKNICNDPEVYKL